MNVPRSFLEASVHVGCLVDLADFTTPLLGLRCTESACAAVLKGAGGAGHERAKAGGSGSSSERGYTVQRFQELFHPWLRELRGQGPRERTDRSINKPSDASFPIPA